MKIKVLINENDSTNERMKKYNIAVKEYGNAIYEKCMNDRHISAEVKSYITPSVCDKYARQGLSVAMFTLVPVGQEFEIKVNLGHVVRVIQYAENEYRKKQNLLNANKNRQTKSPKTCIGRQPNINPNDDEMIK